MQIWGLCTALGLNNQHIGAGDLHDNWVIMVINLDLYPEPSWCRGSISGSKHDLCPNLQMLGPKHVEGEHQKYVSGKRMWDLDQSIFWGLITWGQHATTRDQPGILLGNAQVFWGNFE